MQNTEHSRHDDREGFNNTIHREELGFDLHTGAIGILHAYAAENNLLDVQRLLHGLRWLALLVQVAELHGPP